MVEVLFGESEAGAMKAAKNKIVMGKVNGPVSVWMAGKKTPPPKPFTGWIEGTAAEIICLGFMMDIGNIKEPMESSYRRELFGDFIRHQIVTKCWRREKGDWIIKDAPFVDDWTEKEYQILVSCLKNTVLSGGFVYAAFYDGKLKGFVSVEPEIFDEEQKYCDLSSIHVSEDMRNKGIGRTLFLAAKEWAKQKGAGKLYISAHSAVESQAFYKARGCVEAKVYNQKHVEEEPYDCQLECSL